MSKYDLLPCPFCGGKPILERAYRCFICGKSERVAVVRCRECGARASRVPLSKYGATSHSSEAEKEAVGYWNNRPNQGE